MTNEPLGSYPSPSTVWRAIAIYIAVCFVSGSATLSSATAMTASTAYIATITYFV
jgi:hypothetical protein